MASRLLLFRFRLYVVKVYSLGFMAWYWRLQAFRLSAHGGLPVCGCNPHRVRCVDSKCLGVRLGDSDNELRNQYRGRSTGVKTKPDSTPTCLTPSKPNSVLSGAHIDPPLKAFVTLSKHHIKPISCKQTLHH